MKLAGTLTLLQPYEYIQEKQKSLQSKHLNFNLWSTTCTL